MEKIFEWKRVLFNDLPITFLLEIIFRTTVMFACVLIILKFSGKRGMKQLSIFELAIIISLGSAAGDPMFMEDVGLIQGIVVLSIIVLLYRSLTWLTGKNEKLEHLIEGTTQCIIEDGKFSVKEFKKNGLNLEELFIELRLRNIEHLGQVKHIFHESSGDISVFFYEDKEVKQGLPILPQLFEKKSKNIPSEGIYSCAFCGNTEPHSKGTSTCKVCKNKEWVKAISTKRIT